MRVAVLGGGGFRVPLIHRALLDSSLDIDEIVLQDVSQSRLDVIASVVAGPGPSVCTTTDLDESLDGAALIFAAIRVGGAGGRVHDERTALGLGVLGQETVGAGGLAYALRAVPEAARIAGRIAELAPSAWTISMTNPAGIVTEVMSRTLHDRVIGVCDSPTALVRRACAALGVDAGTSLGTLTANLEVDYAGINHLGWLRSLGVSGVDRLPELVANPSALLRIEEGRLFGPDLIAALACLPNEYLYWYYAAHESLAGVRAAGRTRGELVLAEQDRFYAAASADPSRAARLWHDANDERNRTYFAELRDEPRDELDVAAGGYETIATALAQALVGVTPARLILNVRNGNCIPQLPAGVVVEVPCTVDERGATALPITALTTHQLGLVAQVKACEQAIVDAALTGSRAAALRAFATHPLVGSTQAARALVADWSGQLDQLTSSNARHIRA